VKNLISVIAIFILAQLCVWLQTYGQYKWAWMAKNDWFLLIAAVPISWLWLTATRMGMVTFDNQSWPLRFLGFSTGIIVFTICSRFILNEPITLKSLVSVGLCLLIVCIQILWK
jgi:hypothetical protein